ncbi:hypothetical protein K458DRAFT_395117 [Lentithecium fluviatile CBS 122367]|uniref:Uncharacterized protein n=1 Tax=Lentithecium fluviatile CBS 122367 TaxID=1168545 RepID=A0A6G1IK29_9PLEO|nr:hypothetical protein K458DRAFT_395117 [Lentithecium fluviatile CBS 122367]
MAALATTTLASPTSSPNELSARWDPQSLRTVLCDKLGKCDWNSGDAWNSLWHCYGDWQVQPAAICGGKNSCAGPIAHCV